MTRAGSAPEGAVHNHHEPEAGHAQLACTRARSGRPDESAPDRSVTDSLRSALEVARQRWGTGIGAAAASSPGTGPPDQARGPSRVAGWAAFGHLNSFTRPSAPLRDVWADYADGGRRVAQAAPALWLAYWAAGLPGFAVHCLARFVADSSSRNGRFVALAVAVALLAAGLAAAGVW